MKLLWKQPGGLAECPYFFKWVLDFGSFAIRLHYWLRDDDHRAYHDHPHWLRLLVLKGGYTDVSPNRGLADGERRDTLRAGSMRFREASYQHKVVDVIPGTWTVLITGRSDRKWGFFLNDKRYPRDKYFAEKGHHPCEDGQPAVRLHPRGGRIL